jgi:hypothetical protein
MAPLRANLPRAISWNDTMMIPEFFTQKRPHNGMTPAEYRRYFETEVARAGQAAAVSQDPYVRYLPLNLQRAVRIEATYTPSNKVQTAAQAIKGPQLWMVLTEPWCGDSAQNLPYIAKIAACNASIDLRILLRDRNPDIMDAYLTNGTRSIPKLVAFDWQGRELFQWGPRPQPAVELFHQLKESGAPQEEVMHKLHLWYGRNRGRVLEDEFIALLSA